MDTTITCGTLSPPIILIFSSTGSVLGNDWSQILVSQKHDSCHKNSASKPVRTVSATKELRLYSQLLGLSKPCPPKMEMLGLLCLFPMSRLQTKYPFHSSYYSAKHLYTDTPPVLRNKQEPFQACRASTSYRQEGKNSNTETWPLREGLTLNSDDLCFRGWGNFTSHGLVASKYLCSEAGSCCPSEEIHTLGSSSQSTESILVDVCLFFFSPVTHKASLQL